MEKFKVTFKAENQQLNKVDGIKHASDTYADIEATFILGERWTDMDSILAVWWSDFNKGVTTVLDSEGKCIVPHEVLTRKGCVRVNLVGSVVEGDELVTRLTSYSAEAVQVNEKIKLTGSESEKITPSEYEQFVANVKADADRAETAKEGAREYAESASDSAESALASAQASEASALRSASSASESAEHATASANSAEQANTSAQNAEISAQSAETAKEGAEDARDKILSMRATAETLEPNQSATASYSDGLLTLGIPRGQKGDTGEKGDTGDTGATPNFTIGTVETLEPNESATATITGDAENPVLNLGIPQGKTGEVSYEDLASLLPRDTASGSLVTIPDGQSIIPVESLKVTLEPIQDLHGYDKPWSAGAGKNKFDVDAWIALGRNNTYYSVSDSAVSVIADDVGGIGGRTIQLKPSTQYVISFTNASDCRIFSDTAVTLAQANGWTSASFTTTDSGQIAVKFYGSTYPTVIGKVQIEEGSTATAWTPYENIAPISGWTEVDTHRTGINVWDEEWEVGDVNATTGQNMANDSVIRTKNYIPVLPETTYFAYVGGVTGYYLRARFYDADKNYLGANAYGGTSVSYGRTFKTPTNCYYMRFTPQSNYGTTYNNDISINYPSTDTDYHAYQGTTYTTDLGQTVYGGTLDVVSGELVVDKGYIASYNGETLPSIWISDRDEYASGTTPSIGAEVVYELSTPQTIQLTPQEVKLLLGANNVWSDGDVTMVYSADTALWVQKKLGQ